MRRHRRRHQSSRTTISANHGHSAVITGAQLTAGGAVELNIRGTATHAHTVTSN
jgi:hypothetical protein